MLEEAKRGHLSFCRRLFIFIFSIQPEGALLIKQGAEAKIYKVTFNEKEAILKERLSKLYRHPKLDKKLTKSRLVKESKCMKKCRENLIAVPEIFKLDLSSYSIYMEFIQGDNMADYLRLNLATMSIEDRGIFY